MHSLAIRFICQHANVSFFLREQEGIAVVDSYGADLIFKRQNLTFSVKCY